MCKTLNRLPPAKHLHLSCKINIRSKSVASAYPLTFLSQSPLTLIFHQACLHRVLALLQPPDLIMAIPDYACDSTRHISEASQKQLFALLHGGTRPSSSCLTRSALTQAASSSRRRVWWNRGVKAFATAHARIFITFLPLLETRVQLPCLLSAYIVLFWSLSCCLLCLCFSLFSSVPVFLYLCS